MNQRRRKFVTGPPGAGKGTAGKEFAKKIGARYIESSFFLRAEIATGSALGKRIEHNIKTGVLVEDGDIFQTIRNNRKILEDPGPLVFDGFMRSIPQVEFAFAEILHPTKDHISHIHIDTPDEECVQRMLNRNRPEETPDIIRKRLREYHRITVPAIELFSSRAHRKIFVSGIPHPEEVLTKLLKILAA